MNTWGMHHDANQYENPEIFNPMRFVKNKFGVKDVHTFGNENRKQIYTFGAGRRICPGKRLAEDGMLSSMAKLLWSYDIIAQGQLDTDIRTAFKDSFVTGPKDFPVLFKVRSERKKKSIEEAWLTANEFLEKFK